LASVSVDDVRDVVNVSSAEVPDAKVLKMVKRAEVTLELETSREIGYSIFHSIDFIFVAYLNHIRGGSSRLRTQTQNLIQHHPPSHCS
jgi:hypothetical protein